MEPQLNAPSGIIKANQIEAAEETYFFERHDGSIIAVKEAEASGIIKRRSQVVGLDVPRPKLVGVSNGRAFQTAVIEAHNLHKDGRIEEALARLKKGEEEELAIAKGNIKMPRDFDGIEATTRQPYSLMGTRIRR